jgi:hypothetical protein
MGKLSDFQLFTKLITFAYGRKSKTPNKFIGETGYCSRREADKLIEGRVT